MCTVWYDKSNNVNNNTTIDWKVEKALGIVSCFSIVLLNTRLTFQYERGTANAPPLFAFLITTLKLF